MELLGEIAAGPELSSGIFPSLQAEAAPLWVNSENVLFSDLGLRKSPGLLGLESLPARPTGMRQTVAAGEPRLFIGAGTEAYRYRASDGLTNIGSFAAAGGIYQFLPWDTWTLISNGVDPIELWQNAGVSAPITAPFTRANTLFGYQLQAFVGGTDNGGRLVEWSPVNAVTDWTVTLTGTAGNLLLRELAGDIICAKPIGNSIGIYSRSNAGLFQFIGGTAIYGFRKPISGVGAISPYSVIPYADRHYGIQRQNIFVTDLVSFALVDEPAMRLFLSTNVDWSREQEIYGWPDWANSMARWCVPAIGGGSFTIGVRTDNGTWAKFNDSVVIGEEPGAFASQFLAKPSSLLSNPTGELNNGGAAFQSFAQTKPLSFGDRQRFKRFQKLSFDGSWSGDSSVSVAFTNHPNEVPVFSRTFPLANEIYLDEESQKTESVFLSLKLQSTEVDSTWLINGCKIFGTPTGLVNV